MPGIDDPLDDAEEVKCAAGQPVDARHCQHIPKASLVEHPEKLAPVGTRGRHFLALDVSVAASSSARLLRLHVERLALGADAAQPMDGFSG